MHSTTTNERINNDFQLLRVNVHVGILLLPHMGNLRCIAIVPTVQFESESLLYHKVLKANVSD